MGRGNISSHYKKDHSGEWIRGNTGRKKDHWRKAAGLRSGQWSPCYGAATDERWDGFTIHLEIKLIGFASELNSAFERKQSQGSDRQIFFSCEEVEICLISGKNPRHTLSIYYGVLLMVKRMDSGVRLLGNNSSATSWQVTQPFFDSVLSSIK